MKRDMDYIRDLLLKLEASHEGYRAYYHWGEGWAETNEDMPKLEHHLELLNDAGFFLPKYEPTSGGFAFSGLSWKGAEFLDAVRDDDVWRKTKEVAQKSGGWGLDLMKSIAVEIITSLAKKMIVLD